MIVHRNVGMTERWIRIAAGLGFILIGIFAPIPFWAEEIAGVIGLVLVATGGSGYCPLRHALNRNTSSSDSSANG